MENSATLELGTVNIYLQHATGEKLDGSMLKAHFWLQVKHYNIPFMW